MDAVEVKKINDIEVKKINDVEVKKINDVEVKKINDVEVKKINDVEVKKINDYLNSYQDKKLKFATVYVDRKSQQKYEKTFFKDSSNGTKFYYRVQLLFKKSTKEFILQRDSGTLDIPNNFKELKKLSFYECQKMYNISVWRQNVDSKFACLERRDLKYKKRFAVRYLLRNIFDLNIVKKVLKFYKIDKNKRSLNSLQGVDDNSVEIKFQIINSLMAKNIYCQLISEKNNQAISLLEVFYRKLNCKIDILQKSTERWKLIESCIKNTHSNLHSDYRIKINEIFVVKRWGDRKRFKGNLGNKKLLWHGTRMNYVASILEKGLEVNPAGVQGSTSLMFGKGIYFTNTVSKAANYCGTGANTRSPKGVLFLCEVSLGKMKETLAALPNFGLLQEGLNSVFAKGSLTPDQKFRKKVFYNVEFSYGNLIQIPNRSSQLKHDEFVVYDPAQVKIRYIVLVNFDYKN